MTGREKFLLFFSNARCCKSGRTYVVSCYNYAVSDDIIYAGKAGSAEKAWCNAWQSFKRKIFAGLVTMYSDPWLELPDGVMVPGQDGVQWTWSEFRDDPLVRHLWIDVLTPEPRCSSLLDVVMRLLEQEVCD